jgi:hypothetical protein
MRRDHWKRRNDSLDPATDYVEIYRNLVMHEFPWDMNQALSFALFRTYAVPGIGRLLDRTGEFTSRVQRAHDIPNDQFRYVLSTFVVVPRRWLDDYGKRPMTPTEVEASVHYYRALGRHMNIKDVPETYAEFEQLMDSYEAENFAYDAGGRRVADATLALMRTFYARPLRRPAGVFARALMDQPLREAFRYDAPPVLVQRLSRAGLRARGVVLRAFPARRRPKRVEDISWIRSYPNGYVVEQLGTFPDTDRARASG